MSLRHKIEDQIVAEAWRNPLFKKELLENPKAAIQKHLKITVPEDVEIDIVEEKAKRLCIVLPVNPAEMEGELSLEALDAIAGGTSGLECSPDTWQIGCTPP